ncbi:UDP-N-acetylmuramate dehydrogenase [Luteimonas aestuarii]|uniref:UDP-N-acetylenolpyruvoylglucosamine reductase n=1 Tax=Luteimonas aestuarii TaxID=453837 RepID=A0A4R5TV71_9GAMM|nr:UDP-N-acetylmuramate dehydrogenase [Luteimonas aestuarii]TDK24974.1 UDP-N-acetylmuramate dehydrogenase [Luteimonas aestuarii]
MTPAYTLSADADLRARNSFGVQARAPMLAEVHDARALPDLFADPRFDAEGAMVLGGGSNLLLAGDPDVAMLALSGDAIVTLDDDGDTAIVRAEAGANWHRCVQWTLAQGLGGLENLALIPGTVGAAPIQNIGAYGVEVRECIVAVEAFDTGTREALRFDAADCGFGYRDSRFKREPDRFIVTAVSFSLSRSAPPRLDYAGLRDELAGMGIATPDCRQVGDAVVRIRQRKLPDPAVVGNAGSFFKNPVIATSIADVLSAEHPALPVFRGSDDATRKLSAAWLIDACGWKGHRDGDAGVSAQHALVLVNHGNATGAQLLDLARRIAASVQARFGVALEPEPRIVGARW